LKKLRKGLKKKGKRNTNTSRLAEETPQNAILGSTKKPQKSLFGTPEASPAQKKNGKNIPETA
jgi:hypothetical protein